MPDQTDIARAKSINLAQQFLSKGDSTGWFEELYNTARGDESQIPWYDGVPNPLLAPWLDEGRLKGNGRKAVVIGCGLGEDAEALAAQGFDVTAFDISPSAVDWCKKKYPNTKIKYLVGDLFNLPKEWLGAFDFIYECYTVQALPRSMRRDAIKNISSLLAPGGELLVIQRGYNGEEMDAGPPWPVTKEDLKEFEANGLRQSDFFEKPDKIGEEDVKRIRVLYTRPK